MKKATLITLLLFVLMTAFIVTGFTWSNSMKTLDCQFNAKSLPADGLMIIAPSDPAFNAEVSSMLQGKQAELLPFIEAARPFSIFVKNTSSREVIGCTIKWEILGKDGTVITIPQSYSTPGVLMGMKPLDKSMADHLSLINLNDSFYFTLDQSVKDFIEGQMSPQVRSAATNNDVRDEMQRYITELQAKYQKQLQSIAAITVSIDGVFFKDGTFIGPDTTQYFTGMKAQIDARKEFAESLRQDIRAQKIPGEMFSRIESLSKDIAASVDSNAAPDEYYNQIYKRSMQLYAQEVLRIRRVRGDNKALEYTQSSLDETWPTIRKRAGN
jgi:hypothetical protein